MRWRFPVAAGVLAVSLAGVVVVACSSAPSCEPGTMLLHVGLFYDAPLADTITVVGIDPGASVSASFPHVPNPTAADTEPHREEVDVVVTWPGGYPAGAAVHLTTSAVSGGNVIASSAAVFRLDQRCTETSVIVLGSTDPRPSDGGAGD